MLEHTPVSPTLASFEQLLTLKIGIIGAGMTGRSLVATLGDFGIKLFITDENPDKAQQLCADFPQYNIHVLPWDAQEVTQCDLLLTSPGIPPRSLIFSSHVPVYGDYELAWWLNQWEIFGPRKSWLAITGTNGKTTTVMMCEAILQAAKIQVISCGNIGVPILDILRMHPELPYLLVEMSSFQLHYAPSFCPDIGVLLNIAPDHIDWHGSFAEYRQAKNQILQGEIGIINVDDPIAAQLTPLHKKISLTLGTPQIGQLGIDEQGFLMDHVCEIDVQKIMPKGNISPPTPAGWIDALAASAVARSIGISPDIIAEALRTFSPAAHRGEIVSVNDSHIWVDNSKATNPHATINVITDLHEIYPQYHQILIMGGQLKGADITELVYIAAQYISLVIIFGVDYKIIRQAFLQHAPQIKVICLSPGEDNTQDDHTEVPNTTVSSASELFEKIPAFQLSRRDDHLLEYIVPSTKWNGAAAMVLATKIAYDQSQYYLPALILLAPAAASLDMFSGYAQRGELFQQAVHQILSR